MHSCVGGCARGLYNVDDIRERLVSHKYLLQLTGVGASALACMAVRVGMVHGVANYTGSHLGLCIYLSELDMRVIITSACMPCFMMITRMHEPTASHWQACNVTAHLLKLTSVGAFDSASTAFQVETCWLMQPH